MQAGRDRGRAAGRWAWLGLAIGVAGTGPVAWAGETPVCSTRNLGSRLVYATGRIDVPAAPARVFEAVTDYARLPEYVTAMDSCRVLGRDSLGVLVQQMGTIQLLVRRPLRLTLRFKEEPPSRLRFEIVSGVFPVYYAFPQQPLQTAPLVQPQKFSQQTHPGRFFRQPLNQRNRSVRRLGACGTL